MNLNLINQIKNHEMTALINKLCAKETEVYLVGGYVRDALLGKDSCDKDYVVLGESATELARKVAEEVNGYFVLLDKEFDIARVVLADKVNYFDFACCFGKDIYEDLSRRDFTINAIALQITNITDSSESGTSFIDPYNGMEDLNKKIVRAISEKNLTDDPLRCLRAFRFSAQLGFEIEDKTDCYIQQHFSLMENTANERILAELIKLFESSYCSKNLEKMKNNGILFLIFSELEKQLQVPPNLHHHLVLIDHSIETVKQMEKMINSLPAWVQQHFNSEMANGIKRISLLKMAGLLHDLGKPATWQIDEEGRHRFIKHDEVGSQLGEELLKRLKFSKNAVKYITKLIKYHIYPSQLAREEGLSSEKAILRMFRKLEDETPDVIVLAMCDRLSARGVEITDEIVNNNIENLTVFLEKYKENKEKVDSIQILLSGHDVMAILQIPSSPEIGKILKALKEAQISGEINTLEEAKGFVKGFKFQKDID